VERPELALVEPAPDRPRRDLGVLRRLGGRQQLGRRGPLGQPPQTSQSKRGPSTETIEVKAPVPGLTITPEATGSTAWQLTIKNDGNEPMSILWDESSFVAGDGASWRRLIPGSIRVMDTEKPHAPAPLAPQSTLTETVYPEAMVRIDRFGYDMRRELNGGRLYLAIQSTTTKHMWMGAVTESDTNPLNWWCFGFKNGKTLCLREQAACEKMRKEWGHAATGVTGGEATADPCHQQPSAFCVVSQEGTSFCFASMNECQDFGRAPSIEIGCAERR
jgi:hypothetical protein